MTTPSQDEKDKSRTHGIFGSVFGRTKQEEDTSALDWAVFGCLAAGAVGIIKALEMESPIGVLECLLGAVAAFGLVIYFHTRKG